MSDQQVDQQAALSLEERIRQLSDEVINLRPEVVGRVGGRGFELADKEVADREVADREVAGKEVAVVAGKEVADIKEVADNEGVENKEGVDRGINRLLLPKKDYTLLKQEPEDKSNRAISRLNGETLCAMMIMMMLILLIYFIYLMIVILNH
jgi:hypothetical protein